ncbi:MAG: hypothetical protein EOO42_07455 [Flavobacteriales bacterium]|nr:MAG: hypothetical protein EOO42_07455 [Flavobacteriales bacterium]
MTKRAIKIATCMLVSLICLNVSAAICTNCTSIQSTEPVIYDAKKWKPSSGIIPARFPSNNPASEKLVIERLGDSKTLKKIKINTKFDVAILVEKNGQVSSITADKSAHPLVAKEAIRLLKLLPRATPATKDGMPVRFRIYYNISFKNI